MAETLKDLSGFAHPPPNLQGFCAISPSFNCRLYVDAMTKVNSFDTVAA
jgi:hypothetical protein